MSEPSNYVPYYDLMVIGLNDFHTMLYEILTAMNKDIPEPSPYPFCSISSRRMTMNPEAVNCMIISMAFPGPISEMDP